MELEKTVGFVFENSGNSMIVISQDRYFATIEKAALTTMVL